MLTPISVVTKNFEMGSCCYIIWVGPKWNHGCVFKLEAERDLITEEAGIMATEVGCSGC